jgi:hypothetical protein
MLLYFSINSNRLLELLHCPQVFVAEFFKMQYQQIQQAETCTTTWDMKLTESSVCRVDQTV